MDRHESLVQARLISEALGMPWMLPAHATIISSKIDLDAGVVSVSLDLYAVTETTRETRFVKHGMRMLVWERDDRFANGWKYTCITSWDDDFEPFTDNKIGKIESPAEYRARRDWEAMQYRVGTSRSPMDNAEVASCESDTTPAMYRHWMKG